MKKLLLIISLATLSIEGKSQSPNKMHDLYYPNNLKNSFYPTGLGIRNDTLWIDDKAPVNVIAVRTEKSDRFICVILKPYREYKDVKKNSPKKSKPKAKGKN